VEQNQIRKITLIHRPNKFAEDPNEARREALQSWQAISKQLVHSILRRIWAKKPASNTGTSQSHFPLARSNQKATSKVRKKPPMRWVMVPSRVNAW